MWRKKNDRNRTGAGTFFVLFCFLRCKQKGSHPAAKHYTCYSNTVLFLLFENDFTDGLTHRHPASSLQRRSLRNSPLLCLAFRALNNPSQHVAAPRCDCSQQVGIPDSDVSGAQWAFVHPFFSAPQKGAGTLLAGRALWPHRLGSSPWILPFAAVTCGCYLWSGHYLCFTALNPPQQQVSQHRGVQPPTHHTSLPLFTPRPSFIFWVLWVLTGPFRPPVHTGAWWNMVWLEDITS